jgi:hypothetical protein
MKCRLRKRSLTLIQSRLNKTVAWEGVRCITIIIPALYKNDGEFGLIRYHSHRVNETFNWGRRNGLIKLMIFSDISSLLHFEAFFRPIDRLRDTRLCILENRG